MKTYTIRKTIRTKYQKSTADMYPQTIGPFEDRRLAEQALAQIATSAEVESAHIVVDETDEKE